MPKNKTIPKFDLPMIETHCHLDYLKQDDTEALVAKAHAGGVEKIITISVEPSNLDQALEIAENFEHVYCTQGVHPHEAKQFTSEVEEKIRARTSKKIVAIGEIGLDYYYDHSPRQVQQKVFETQLALAGELDLPVVIHTRDADEDTMAILKNMASSVKRLGVVHSFTSSKELAEFALDLGFCLGFNGIISFKSAQNVREIAELTPLDRILLETDAPFLTPTPFRGVENAPHYLPLVAEHVAATKSVDVREVLKVTYQTSQTLFGLPS